MDKTYTEAQNEKPFDWNKFLDDAILHNFDDCELEMANLAADWVTCACGNQCAIIPRNYAGLPNDKILAILGLNFSSQISLGDWQEAKNTLQDIEARAAIVIQETLADLNAK